MRSSLIRQLTGLISQPDIISFAAGSPNAQTFPHESFRQIQNELIDKEGGQIFQYSVTRGNARLIQAVVERNKDLQGINSTPEKTLLFSGSQQGLDIVARVLLDPGDAVFVESPSFIGATYAFENLQARLFAVQCDMDGMDIDHLAARISEARRKGHPCKFIYVIPNFQNPSGAVWSKDRRKQLYELACGEQVLIFEDDAYGEIYFEGVDPESLCPLKSLDEQEIVIYMSTFSKILSPGLRVAWVHGPQELVRRFEYCKETSDLCTATLSQRIALEFLKRDLMQQHVESVRKFYTSKARKMQEGLEKHFKDLASWQQARGGLFQWLQLPEGMDTLKLFHASIQQDKVAFIPGASFYAEGGGENTLRLSFSNIKDENIDTGLSRLKHRIREIGT